MTFFARDGGWYVQFCESDAKTPLPLKLNFKHADKVRELARRGEALGTWEQKAELERQIEVGRGTIHLRLTPGQYSKLRRTLRQS
jgi:hypothetical protein